MATLKYENKNVDPGQNFDKPFPQGLYKMEVESVEVAVSQRSGEDMLKVTLFVAEGEHKGRKVWEYIVQNEASAFRMRQFTDSLGVKPDGAITYDEDTKLVSKIGGKKVDGARFMANIKVEPGDDEFGPSNKVKNFIKKDGDEEEETGEEETAASGDEADERSEDEYTWSDLEGMERDELVEFMEENESDLDADEYEDDDDGNLNLREALAEEYGIEVSKPKKKAKKGKGKKKTEEAPDFSSMSLEELKDECKERELSPKGTKKVLVKRLEKAASTGGTSGGEDDPF